MNLKNKKVLITGATGGIGNCIVKKLDELDQTILTMKGQGNSDKEIHEAVNIISEKEITLGNLRVKTNRARIKLAKLTGKKYE